MDAVNDFDASAAALRSVLDGYDTITLVANNPQIELQPPGAGHGKQLFVFLNTAVPLQGRTGFDADCIVISGVSSKEIFALKSDRVAALDHVAPGRCKAVCIIPTTSYGGRPKLKNWTGRWLELSLKGPWFYPRPQHPSTGFVALNYLLRTAPTGGKVRLVGFTGRSSTRRKLNNLHDWVYEQLYIRMLAEAGKVILEGDQSAALGKADMLRRSFPEMAEEQFNRVMHSYAMEELSYLKASMHGVIKILSPVTVLAKKFHFG
jgi:hypothetical protein